MCKAAMDAGMASNTAPWSPPWRVTASSSPAGQRPAGAMVYRPGAAGDRPMFAGYKPEDSGLDIGDSATPKPTVLADLLWRPRPLSSRGGRHGGRSY